MLRLKTHVDRIQNRTQSFRNSKTSTHCNDRTLLVFTTCALIRTISTHSKNIIITELSSYKTYQSHQATTSNESSHLQTSSSNSCQTKPSATDSQIESIHRSVSTTTDITIDQSDPTFKQQNKILYYLCTYRQRRTTMEKNQNHRVQHTETLHAQM